MTNQEINVAIAEACDTLMVHDSQWIRPMRNPNRPDYANDLNAMHEAEKLFNPPNGDDWGTYLGFLDLVKSRVHAPSKARAEAFLRTLGKWKE